MSIDSTVGNALAFGFACSNETLVSKSTIVAVILFDGNTMVIGEPLKCLLGLHNLC
jgi:hypothetical protein